MYRKKTSIQEKVQIEFSLWQLVQTFKMFKSSSSTIIITEFSREL